MKKILTILVCTLIILSLSACTNSKNEFDIGKESNIEIEEKGVSLLIKENTLTKTGATLILKNDSDVVIQYGEPYEIEIKKDGKWHKINVELNFIMPAYIVNAKESKEIELNWSYGYGKLTSGNYRIIKDINIKNAEGSYEKFYVSAEFSIE